MDLSPAFEGLNDRDRIYLQSRLSGMSQAASAAAAGMAPQHASEYEKQPRIAAALQKGREIGIQATGVTREKVSEMLMDAYRSAETAAEMVMASRELGRLHGLYAPQRVELDHTHKLQQVKSEQDIRRLTTADLVKLVSKRGGDVIEGDFVALPAPGKVANGEAG